MLPTVFLSLAGTNEAFVAGVQEHLPAGLAYFYPQSFANGENLISAMEARVPSASVFVLFASKISSTSVWVNFELNRARLETIRHRNFRILIFPIDGHVTHRDLPEWMREYWIPGAGQSSRDIARYIRSVLEAISLGQLKSANIFGRGNLLDLTIRQLQESVFLNARTPNILIFAGNEGIGRRTVSREFFRRGFPGLPDLNVGPEFSLPQFADLEDLYRSLRQEIEPKFSISGFTQDLLIFRGLSIEEQAGEISSNISRFADLGQAVTIVTGNGIFEDRGVLKTWAPRLFSALALQPAAKLCLVTNRLLHENELRPHSNVLQFSVPALADADIRALMIAAAEDYDRAPQLPSGSIITAIGGHPQIAKLTARLIAQQGAAVVDHDPRKLYDMQEEILSESLGFDRLTDIEKDIMSVLSWVPHLSSDILADVIVGSQTVSNEAFSNSLSSLERGCLISSTGPAYAIAAPVRSLFRRKYGFGSVELRASFAKSLRERWQHAAADDSFRTELFDALVFMAALEGGTLDPAFRGLLLPSTLQSVVRAAYDNHRRDEGSLERVVSWGLPAIQMKMDETTREEILTYVVRAQCRLGRKADAEETLKFIDKKAFRSRFYLRSFFIRHCGGETVDAIAQLKSAYGVRKYMTNVVADLALCYQRLGRWNDLRELIQDQVDFIDRSPGLLDVQAGFLIASRRFPDAESVIIKLRNHPYEDGRADSRMAMIMMHRDQDFKGAQRVLTENLQSVGAILFQSAV